MYSPGTVAARFSEALAMAVKVGTSQGLIFRTAKAFLTTSAQSFWATAFFKALRAPSSLNWPKELPLRLLAYFFCRLPRKLCTKALFPGSPHTH